MATTEPLTGADAAWLHMDRPTNLMVVNCVFWFDRPVDWTRVATAFAERLVPKFPRFAQRVLEPPVTIGLIGPRWQDVAPFDVEPHLHHVTLPAPGDDARLHAYVSEQAGRPLDTSRPLWEAHLLDGYGGGCAILLRTHHALADGTALVQALLTLVDPPEEGPGHAGQLPLIGEQAVGMPARGLPRPRRSWWDVGGIGGLLERASKLGERSEMLRRLGFGAADEPSPLRGPLSGRKRVTWTSSVPLDGVKQVARAHDATVNDVALAVVAGALRRHLSSAEQEVSRLTAVVPVNLRPLDQPFDPRVGNQFGLAFVRLPVDQPDPTARLLAVKAAMDRVKSTGEGVVISGALSVLGHTPVQVEQRWLDLFAGRATAVVTNIAGPREPVTLAGVPLSGFTAWVPSTGPVGIGLSICSYAGELLLGVAVDEALLPEPEQLLGSFSEEVIAFRKPR